MRPCLVFDKIFFLMYLSIVCMPNGRINFNFVSRDGLGEVKGQQVEQYILLIG